VVDNSSQKSSSRQTERQRKVRKILRNLRYLVGLSGAGYGASQLIENLRSGEIWEALIYALLTIIAVVLAVGLTFIRDVLNQVLDKVEELLQAKVEPLATWIVEQLTNLVLVTWSTVVLISKGFWWRTTAKFKSNYYDYLINIYKTYRYRDPRMGGAVTLDLDKVFVKPRVSLEYPDTISSSPIRKQDNYEERSIWQFLAKSRFQRAYRRIVLLGPAGSGKTTLLEHLTLIYAEKTHSKQHGEAPNLIPVLLPLWQVHNWVLEEPAIDLPKIVARRLSDEQFHSPFSLHLQWFQTMLKLGKCLILLDGLDEIADIDERHQIGDWLDRQMRTYSKALFIITSRSDGYLNPPLQEVGMHLEIKSFNLKQRQELIYNLYLQNTILSQNSDNPESLAESRQKQLTDDIQNHSELEDMARNPLFLTMMVVVHDRQGGNLPASRIELYDKILKALLGRRGNAKSVSNVLELEEERIKIILKFIAMELMESGKVVFSLDRDIELVQKIELYLSQMSCQFNLEAFIKHIEQITGILVKKESQFHEFFHPSFQEYLASSYIESLNQKNIFLEKIHESWWHETLFLYSTKNDVSEFIYELLTSENLSPNSLTFICEFIEENSKIDSSQRQELKDHFNDCLESNNSEVFKLWTEGKLSRRLKKLSNKFEGKVIDVNFITCAEYQLFIDENTSGDSCPLQWEASRFSRGLANHPVLGVTSYQAESFCQWLNRRFERERFSQGCRYRLLNEVEASGEQISKFGFWYNKGNLNFLATGASEDWNSWEKSILELVKKDLRRDLLQIKESIRNLDTIGFTRDQPRKDGLDSIFRTVLNSDFEIQLKYLDLYNPNFQNVIAHTKSKTFDIRKSLNPIQGKNTELIQSLGVLSEILGNKKILLIPNNQHILAAYSLYAFLHEVAEGINGRSHLLKVGVSNYKNAKLDEDFISHKRKLLHSYAYSLVTLYRKQSGFPAWEGIRIVREIIPNDN